MFGFDAYDYFAILLAVLWTIGFVFADFFCDTSDHDVVIDDEGVL